MKKLTVGEQFSQPTDVKIDEKGNTEKMSLFYVNTMSIVNSGRLQYRDMKHYKEVRRAIKSLEKQKLEPVVFLEDSDYRTLFGEESNPGILRSFNGWISSDATDMYIEIWENAEQTSIEVVRKIPKALSAQQAKG